MKQLVLALAVLGVMIRGYFVYQQQQIHSAQQAGGIRQTLSQIRRNVQGPDAEADAAARGNAPAAKAPAPAPPAPPAVNHPAEAQARAEIEAALKDMHVTSIMPGQPGMFIIGKQDYSEGESLPLPKGRKAQVVAVRDDGVQLTCEGMAFHLDAPAAPDLAASRKKR